MQEDKTTLSTTNDVMQTDTAAKKKELEARYALNEGRTLVLYHFISKYNKYILGTHDYGTGELVSMMEVHWLTLIADNPGITATMLAAKWQCTPGAASQVIKKLVTKELIRRCKEKGNAKVVHLYATEKGEKLSEAHKAYDTRDETKIDDNLTEHCTPAELDAFFKVMRIFTDTMEKRHE